MKMFRYENLIEFYVDYARIDGIEYVRILKKKSHPGKGMLNLFVEKDFQLH